MIKQIPNTITSLNLLCGCVAIFFAVSGDLVTASFFAISGIFFDFFDGLLARVLKVQSRVGLELDSLADVVTSGVVPAIVMVQLLSQAVTGKYIVATEIMTLGDNSTSILHYLPFTGLLIAIASAYRLAKFNVDTRQSTSFIGLPTPANTLLIISLPLILHFQYSEMAENIILNKWSLLALTVLSCILLNSELKLFGLKYKSWDFKKNIVRYIYLIMSVVLLCSLQFIAIPMVIVLYIGISLFWKGN